ncbi:MAG: histidinol dehydrogenase [Candidatus Melainabacteria bacterium GWF2_32_7]|nr:MAG: histidinol dehydrogenase [Candidatus Melainabacteria bacterium GWF2_32_7]
MKIININELNQDFFQYKEFPEIEIVPEVISNIKKYGNKSITEYSKKFGDGDLTEFTVSKAEIDKAFQETPPDIIDNLNIAISNIREFAKAQFSILKNIEIDIDGIKLGHKIIPLNRIGAYVPGGNYPLPSSALMSIIPAKIAGVEEVIVCSPKIQPITITACKLAGADKIFRIGGVQAIAAMAYGTETIPKVDKIVGPGNKFVTAAKKEVYGICGIDFLAGPSEVMILADETANPEFIAADLLAQAEHDKEAEVCLITTSKELAEKVNKKIEQFLAKLETSDIAGISIQEGIIILVDNMTQAIDIANKKAPEHLEICFDKADTFIDKFKNYGSLFIGNYSAEVFGDYCSGTNHILPTNGIARYTGGLSVFDFVKIQSFQQISKQTAQSKLCATASKIAQLEGLYAHKLSSDLRSEN